MSFRNEYERMLDVHKFFTQNGMLSTSAQIPAYSELMRMVANRDIDAVSAVLENVQQLKEDLESMRKRALN